MQHQRNWCGICCKVFAWEVTISHQQQCRKNRMETPGAGLLPMSKLDALKDALRAQRGSLPREMLN